MKKETQKQTIIIPPANIQVMDVKIIGIAPYVQHKFSQKVKREMLLKQIEGSTARGKKKHAPRDIEQDYKDSIHMTEDGNPGIPAPAFRSAMISACRLVGFQMTKAKLSVFIRTNDIDVDDGTPLVKIIGKHEMHQSHVRLESGVASIAIRAMWRKWKATVRVEWDADQFSQQDVLNLMSRAGKQVGIGEGRPDSKKSHGMGWGTFELA